MDPFVESKAHDLPFHLQGGTCQQIRKQITITSIRSTTSILYILFIEDEISVGRSDTKPS